jgi:hypothetical protein
VKKSIEAGVRVALGGGTMIVMAAAGGA